MARAPEIGDFAAKLGLLLDRLNWSRAQLAQRAGVDKSVAQRWVGGQVQPGEASLVALTAAIAANLPDFARPDWRLPLEAFAARFAPQRAASAEPAAALFPRVAGAAPPIAQAASRYGGFWLVLHASVQSPEQPRIVGYLAGIAGRGGTLWMEVEGSVQGTWRGAGPCFALHRLLYLALEEAGQGDSMAFAVLTGVLQGRAMVLDGVGSSAASSLRGPAVATRMVALRLDDAAAPPWRGEALRQLVRRNAKGLGALLPEGVAARFVHGPMAAPRAMVMAVSAESSLACDAEEIAQGLAPDGAAALAAARAICGLA
jgi:transcriptional regulator with XRE-family HTH domain